MKHFLYIVFGILLMIALVVFAFFPEPVLVDLATVSRGALQVYVEEDGKTRIKERYEVASPLAGRLMRIELKPGDSVKAGKSLVALIEPSDPALLDARALAETEARVKASEAKLKQASPNLERAKVAAEFAETEFGRIRKLRDDNVATDADVEEKELVYRTRAQEFSSARFAEEIARFELEMTRAALLRTKPGSEKGAENSHFEIHSPINGRVLRVFQKSATVVSSGTELLELGDPADLEVEIDVLSFDAVKIQAGNPVSLEHWGGEEPLRGIVRLVEPSAFTKVSALGVEEQRVNVIIDFVDPYEQRESLGDAFRVEARIVVWEEADVLKIPTSALFREGEAWAVFCLRNGQAALQLVQIGQRNGLEAEVLDGLKEGDRVIIHPSDRISPGASVSSR